MGYREPSTREQALAEALYLELVAGDDEGKRAACRLLVDEYSDGLDPAIVEMCRAHVHERFEAEHGGTR